MSSPPEVPTASVAVPKPERPSNTRLPSLNQLAARININAHSSTSTSGAAGSTPSANPGRPRLAASILRTGSTTSLLTNADSTAANPPSTRSASPSGLSNPSRSNTTTPSTLDQPPGDPLTADRLEKLEEETGSAIVSPEKKIKGYKNIPSLNAITAHLTKTKSLSVDGTAKPPEPEVIEDPRTPGVKIKAPEHPLQYSWTMFHDTKVKAPFTPGTANSTDPFSAQTTESGDYEAGLTVIGEFDTVESFCRYFNWLKPPSKLECNSNYHLFKSGIKPMWEDEANANGGKWVLTMKNNPALLDRCWSFLAMALVGEELEEGNDICGAVVSLRSKLDRIQVWTRSKDDVEKLNGIGKRLIKLLDVSEADNIGLEFQYNTDDRPIPNKFLSISALPTTSYRGNFQGTHVQTKPHSVTGVQSNFSTGGETSQAHQGAFGSFGIGNISAWRGRRS